MMRFSYRNGEQPDGRQACRSEAKLICRQPTRSRNRLAGYSLVEVVVAVGIIALVYGAIIDCYIQSGLRAEWSGYSLAAQSLADEQVEQACSAVWDPVMQKNELTNLDLSSMQYTSSNRTWTGYATTILDVPYATTNYTIATNFVSIQLINLNNSSNPPVQMQMIRVDTVWPFKYRAGNVVFTNTAATLMAPDNRDRSTM